MMIWKKSEAEETPAHPQPQPPTVPPSPVRGQAQSSKERALVGASIEIKGNLAGSEDLVVEGRIEGKIELRQHGVTVGRSGCVKGDVYGLMIVVMGEIDGNLYGEEQIILRQTCTVHGNISSPRVTLEDGAHFKGSIDMAPPTTAEAGVKPA
jgi:cytoskeletal protein CcmA (bactofilin family)